MPNRKQTQREKIIKKVREIYGKAKPRNKLFLC